MKDLAADGASSRWRLDRWPTDRTVAHIVFTNMLEVPTVGDFETAAVHAAATGSRAVRTSALFPRAQEAARTAGFLPIDTLRLLRLDLTDEPAGSPAHPHGVTNRSGETSSIDGRSIDGHSNVPSSESSCESSSESSSAGRSPSNGAAADSQHKTPRNQVRPMRIWHLTSAVDIDRRSFGDDWGNSTHSLQQILGATERARARVARDPRDPRSRVDGFIISGVTDTTGYIQRLAVHPEHRRRGLARSLVVDALGWMRRVGATGCFVNTGVDNTSALALYRSLGFVDTGEVLTVNERSNLDDYSRSQGPRFRGPGSQRTRFQGPRVQGPRVQGPRFQHRDRRR